MMGFTDAWVIPWLGFLVEWSIRWGIVLLFLAAWFALRSPRGASIRHVLCWAAIVAGLLIPFCAAVGKSPDAVAEHWSA